MEKSKIDSTSMKKIILDALEDETLMGRPNNPTIPLVGSLNVPISPKEEKECE